jgi:hypothetical protein
MLRTRRFPPRTFDEKSQFKMLRAIDEHPLMAIN